MYELWDAETRNVIRFFSTATEGVAVLSEIVREQGPSILESLFLVCEDEHDESTLVAEGQAMLVALRRLGASEQATRDARRVG